ncbi:hypothetical protein E2C01_070582 [Portunus trituberculatus]|uniref:Uncharacterized protein n=1 Tax=Portunus trituberculatus TaxID=210409 RepID=A0A5B7I2H1_PORTR|nr:hypothetical protein [Portunus trituberculatus]
MKLLQRSYLSTMAHTSAPTVPTPQVTLISESLSIPPFTGVGSESIRQFIRRIGEECTRRNAHLDVEKLAILKSRICHDPSSLAGKLVKSDKFLSLPKYVDFTAAFVSHFSNHSKLGATHSFLKVASSLTYLARITADVYKAENIASSLSAELTDQLKSSQWFNGDGMLSSANFKRLMSYLLFVVQLDSPTFAIASGIEFTEKDFLYDVCKQISEKSPPAPQSVSVAQTSPPTPVPLPTRTHSPSCGRSSSRPSHRIQYRHWSHSHSSRNVACHRCGIRGHVQSCHVVLDDQGRTQFNQNAFCSLHNKRGHSLAECCLYQLQCSSQPSGNAERQSLTPQP